MEKLGKESIDALYKVAQTALKKDVRSINTLYVGLDCFFDFRIGALLCLIKTNSEYKYILDNIKNYNNRRDDITMNYFKELPYTNEDIDNFINDKSNNDKLLQRSPPNDYYKLFHVFGNAVMGNNKLTEDLQVPVLYIGCDKVRLSPEYKEKLVGCIKKQLQWNIIVTDGDIYSYGDERLKSFDHVTIYDVIKLLGTQKFNHLYEDCSFLLYRSVHSFPFIDRTLEVDVNKVPLSDEAIIQNSEIVLNVICDFKYIIMDITYEK